MIAYTHHPYQTISRGPIGIKRSVFITSHISTDNLWSLQGITLKHTVLIICHIHTFPRHTVYLGFKTYIHARTVYIQNFVGNLSGGCPAPNKHTMHLKIGQTSVHFHNESTKVHNPRLNSLHHALNSKCQGPSIYKLCIILRMRVECLAAPSPVSRLFHAGCTSS